MPDFSLQVTAAAVWFAIHPGIAGSPARAWLVSKIGENGFRALFSLLSVAALTALVLSYARAPFYPLWFAPRAVYHVPLMFVPLAFVLLIGAFTVPNPTVVMGERALKRDEPARGVLRVTRHPFLWAVAIWSVMHGLVNGDVASLLFFGSLGVTALVGTFDIDRKRRRSSGADWERFRAVTSNVPFAAVLAGRNQLVFRELVVPFVLGAVVSLLVLHFHVRWFGVSPLP